MKTVERFSCYSHLIGFILAILGTAYLIYHTSTVSLQIVVTIYGLSVMVLFLASTLYHTNKEEENEDSIWRKLDHSSIFIMIAGTYTPVSYIYLAGYWRWGIILSQWLLVLGGIFFKFFYLSAPRYLSTIIYLLMGWMGIAAIVKLVQTMSLTLLVLLFAGGLSYTVGALFYIFKKPQLTENFGFHEIFHLFILLGAIFHYCLIYFSVLHS
ncbi:MAG: PAQR family membrane homeostasis protein TrhA [Bacillota bacterium]